MCLNLKPRKRQPLPPQRDNSPVIPLLIRLLVNLGRERNRRHDPVPKLLVQHRLVRIPIVLHDLVKTVDQRLLGRHFHGAAAVREARELLAQLVMGDAEERRELLDVLGGGLGLAVEDCGGGDFVAADVLGDLLKGEGFGGFGGEERCGGGGKVGVLGRLLR